MSAATATQPERSFLEATRAMGQLIFSAKSLAQVKVEYFIFLNTICYQEYESHKRITTDEFINGRKRKDGSRFTSGCGLKTRKGVIEGLRDGSAGDQKHIDVVTEDKDAARIRKSYGLNLPGIQEFTVDTPDSTIIPINSRASSSHCEPLEFTVDTPVVHDVNPGSSQRKPRSGEGMGGSASSRYLEESTLYAADAAVDAVVSVEPVEEEDTPMSPAAPVTSDDGYPFKPLQMPSKSDRLRSKLQKERQQPTLLEVSDSQAQPDTSTRERLSEEAASENTSTTTEPENEELRYYRELLIKQQRQLKDEEDYLGLCEPASKPEVERNIEMYRAAVASTEQTILDLQPAPALDDSNWQSQLFGGLCRLAGASPERISGTPLAKTLGQAAAKIKAHKRRPDELQHMWQRFRTDARFRWMNGRGDTGKLMMLFASNAAVL